ncbi:MAG: DUF4402 domain-containing protein [Alphaproteobacteria bacterium]
MSIKKIFAGLSVAVIALVMVPDAWSATQSVTANIRFDTPLNLNKTADIDFKSVTAGQANTYTISPTGTTSVSGGGSGAFLFGTPNAASITISGSTTQTLNISAAGYTANNGVTPANATCKYGAAAAGSCTIPAGAAPGASTVLLVGADAVVDGTQAGGTTAAPTFTLTIVYN